MSRSKRARTDTSSLASTAIRVDLGAFSAGAADRAQELHTGLPLASFASGGRAIDREIESAGPAIGPAWSAGVSASGDRATRTRSSSNRRLPTIGRERRRSAMPTFWPCRGSPICGGAATRWCWSRRAPARCSGSAIRRSRAALAMLSTPQRVGRLRRRDGFPGTRAARPAGGLPDPFQGRCRRRRQPAAAEGDANLVLWDFHDLLFHTRSTQGRHANPVGGRLSYAGVTPRRRRCGPLARKKDRSAQARARAAELSPAARLLRERHSIRSFDDARPITLAELARFLDGTARVLSHGKAGSTSATPVRWSPMRCGPIRRRARATSSSSIWRSTNATGWRGDSITTTPADTR